MNDIYGHSKQNKYASYGSDEFNIKLHMTS